MAQLVANAKPLTVNPLKVSQPIGASLAFMGLSRTMPLEHGARGCTSFNKLFFMRHFDEPIPLQTTAMDMVTTVMGPDDNVVEALATIAEKNAPEIVGLITTGLSETQGADIPRTIKAFRAAYPQYDGMSVVPVNATDTTGCLESGFALAVEAIIAELVPDRWETVHRPWQINVLVSSMLTPGDLETLRDWIEIFGLSPIFLPDLADSLDGHLIPEGFSTLTYGGSGRDALQSMGQSAATLVIGASLNKAADLLKQRTGVTDFRFDGLMGLEECDAFTQVLADLSRRPVPPKLERQRTQLLDALVDCNFHFGDTPVAIAADPDLLGSFCRFLNGLGAEVVSAVSSTPSPRLASLPVAEVQAGDLEDLENAASSRGAQLLITNSHGAEIARRLKLPLLRAGFPLYDIAGGHARAWIGYRGSRQTVFDMSNLLQGHRQEIQPHRSIFWQGTPRMAETGEVR
ncbi:MAG TPA: nitrogenase iron-molybdenum cofactor biosynthesis protein NifN [Candidatus Sulfotelmatobacter sp.]|nr:nitrogenase iron-molybdenum cofactor biosynthesis protein NifN [Candidatus Sulfotelmatobacter sp.]